MGRGQSLLACCFWTLTHRVGGKSQVLPVNWFLLSFVGMDFYLCGAPGIDWFWGYGAEHASTWKIKMSEFFQIFYSFNKYLSIGWPYSLLYKSWEFFFWKEIKWKIGRDNRVVIVFNECFLRLFQTPEMQQGPKLLKSLPLRDFHLEWGETNNK